MFESPNTMVEFTKYGAMCRKVRLMRGDFTDVSGNIACFQYSMDIREEQITDAFGSSIDCLLY